MSANLIPARWLFDDAIVITLVEVAEDGSHWSYLIARHYGPGAYVVNFDDSGNVLVNGLPVKLSDAELYALCSRVDEPFMGHPRIADEIGRPHGVAPTRAGARPPVI